MYSNKQNYVYSEDLKSGTSDQKPNCILSTSELRAVSGIKVSCYDQELSAF